MTTKNKKRSNEGLSEVKREKPISLFPLTLDETLTELLKVKPPPEGWHEPKKTNKAKKNRVKK